MVDSIAFNNKMKKNFLNYLAVITILLVFTACSKNNNQSNANRRAPAENPSAQINEIEQNQQEASNQQYYNEYRSNQDPYKNTNVQNYIDKYNLKAKRTPHENQILIGNIEDQNPQEKWVSRKKKSSNNVLSQNTVNNNAQNSGNTTKSKIEHDYSGPMAIFNKNKTKVSKNLDTSNQHAAIEDIAKPMNQDNKKIVVKHNKDPLKHHQTKNKLTKKDKVDKQNTSGKPKSKKITFADDVTSGHDIKAPENKTATNHKIIENPKPSTTVTDDAHHKDNKIKIDQKEQKPITTPKIVKDNSAPATSNTKPINSEEVKPIESKKDNSKGSIANKITAAEQEIIKDAKQVMDKVVDHKKQQPNVVQPNQNEVVSKQKSTDPKNSKHDDHFVVEPSKNQAKPDHESLDKNQEKNLAPQEPSKQENSAPAAKEDVKVSPPAPPQLPSAAPKQASQSKLTDIPSVFSFVAIKKFMFYLKTTLLDFFRNIL